jgi:hypothetical protein
MGSLEVTESRRFRMRSSNDRLFHLILYVRDVGVAGSNPVTMTIDLIEYFHFY